MQDYKILVSVPLWHGKMSGVEYHRLHIPFRKQRNVIFHDLIEAITKEYLIENNIKQVWFNRNIAPQTLDPDRLFKLIKSLGITIVCDIDDSWEIPFGHVLHNVTKLQNRMNSNISQIKCSDYVVCTHSVLANKVIKELKYPANRVLIAPNAIDDTEPQYNQPFDYNLTNVFWQGSVTHHHDLKTISKAVNELNIKLNIAGYEPESYFVNKQGKKVYHWDETGKLFNKKQFIHAVPIESYMNAYNGKGLCLIPLENTPFTACKSNLKMLEAGWAKKPVISSGVHPYTTIGKDGKNCLFAYTHKAWVEAISYMLANPNFADDMRHELHQAVKNNYLLKNVNQTRINLIEK